MKMEGFIQINTIMNSKWSSESKKTPIALIKVAQFKS